jgi:hypothetical protein
LLYHGGYYQWIRYKTYANTEGKLMARLTDFHRQQPKEVPEVKYLHFYQATFGDTPGTVHLTGKE